MRRANSTTADKAARRAELERALGERQRALPERRYGVILADPPWRFEPWSRTTGMDRAAENHYPTLTIDQLLQLPIERIAARDCVLFLWSTGPMLPEALELLSAWGFRYCSNLIWIKNRVGLGFWFRYRHELLLVGRKGNAPAPAPGTQPLSVLEAPRGRHSAKPEVVYAMIERLYPSLPRIELFARGRRPGWDAYGAEVDGPLTGEPT